MDNNNINIEEIMADIRKKIKDEDLTADMLSFEDVPYKKPVQVKAGTLEAADESLRYLNTRYYIQPYKQLQGNPVKVFIKKVLRKMIKFYIEPVVFEQNDFNANTVVVLNTLRENAASPDMSELRERLDMLQLEKMFTRLFLKAKGLPSELKSLSVRMNSFAEITERADSHENNPDFDDHVFR